MNHTIEVPNIKKMTADECNDLLSQLAGQATAYHKYNRERARIVAKRSRLLNGIKIGLSALTTGTIFFAVYLNSTATAFVSGFFSTALTFLEGWFGFSNENKNAETLNDAAFALSALSTSTKLATFSSPDIEQKKLAVEDFNKKFELINKSTSGIVTSRDKALRKEYKLDD